MNLNDDTSPFAPVQFDMEGCTLKNFISGPEGIIVAADFPDGTGYIDTFHFYSPANSPHHFYQLNHFMSGFDEHFTNDNDGFVTHHGGKEMYVYTHYSCGATIIYSDDAPSLYEWQGKKSEWGNVPAERCEQIREGMLSGDIQFLSLPTDNYIDHAFKLPEANTDMQGTIAFCRATYNTHLVSAFFIPQNPSQPVVNIAFYKDGKRLSYRDSIEQFLYGRAGITTISLNEGLTIDQDFTGIQWFSDEGKAALRDAQRIPSVSKTRTPLITPVLYQEKMAAKSVEALPQPSPPAP